MRYIPVSLPYIDRRILWGLPSGLQSQMEEPERATNRRSFRWPGEAREVVRAYRSEAERLGQDAQLGLKGLITRLVQVSGNPRDACWRFARQAGVGVKQAYRPWTRSEQQKLLDLIATHPVHEVTLMLRRSPASVRSMLQRLGATARMGQDWFTKYTLAEALHVRAEDVQKWIDRGWLKCRTVQTGRLTRDVVDADDFCEFCKHHRSEIMGRRLNLDRLSFVQTFVFPPSHMELLPVRESKKERAAYKEQMKRGADNSQGNGEGVEDDDWGMSA